MVFFVIFILSAVLIGVGAMLAPALPTAQPRIGLSSALALFFVLAGGIFWTHWIGWDTLVIDYLLFGAVSLVVLGGTMIQAHQVNNEDDAPEAATDDEEQWLNRDEFIFLLIVAMLCLLSLLIPIQPPDMPFETGQTLEAIQTLYPQIISIGATAFYVLSVYLTQQLQQDYLIVQQAIICVLIFLCVFTTYDLGVVIKNTLAGKILAMGVCLGLLIGLWLQPEWYTLLPLVLLSLTILIFIVRIAQYRQRFDMLALILLSGLLFYI